MRISYIASIVAIAFGLFYPPTASACSMNPTAVISAPAAASSHIHGTAVGFNGSTSTANCGTIIGYLWKNGSTTLSTSPTFNYTVTLAPEQVDSVITVSLKVTSTYNARTHTVYRTITIKRDHQSQYFVKDHLGSPRVVVDGKGAVLSHTDYYPFGMVMPGRASNISLSNDRTKFTGYLLEEEGEQDTYHAEARGYDPVIGRFTSRDPLTKDFPSWAPYHYVHNNPISLIDPSGMSSENLHQGIAARVGGTGEIIVEEGDGFEDVLALLNGDRVNARRVWNAATFVSPANDGGKIGKDVSVIDAAAYLSATGFSSIDVLIPNSVKFIFFKWLGAMKRGGKVYNSVAELLAASEKLPDVKGGEQRRIIGNIDNIFDTLANGREITELPGGRKQVTLTDGTIITKYPATSGGRSLQINEGGKITKVRVE